MSYTVDMWVSHFERWLVSVQEFLFEEFMETVFNQVIEHGLCMCHDVK